MSSISWFWGPWSRCGLGVALAALILDQAHKTWMLTVYRIQDKGRVALTPFLDLVFVQNPGISYGLLPLPGWAGQILLTTVAVFACLVLNVWLARLAADRLAAASVGLIIGGALGNAVDRVLREGVVDFFSLHAFEFYWYVFNIADVAIVAGAIGLVYDSLMANRKGASKAS
ncbi:MAG: signal peptidase II [Hyphomicrobiaceae bacterium]